MKAYLNPDQVCERLQIPKATLYELTRAKRIPFTKVGRRLRFDEDTIHEWFRKNSVPDTDVRH